MSREFIVFGMIMPTLVPIFFVCTILMWLLDRYVLVPRHVYKKVLHPPLFRIALFVLLFCLAGLMVY